MFLHICLFHDCCGGRCSANFLATSLIASGVLKGSFSLLCRSFGIEKQEKINKKLKNQKNQKIATTKENRRKNTACVVFSLIFFVFECFSSLVPLLSHWHSFAIIIL